MQKTCKWCGKPSERSWCNEDCKRKHRNKLARESYERRRNREVLTITCKWCGKPFETRNMNQKFCCDDHRQKFFAKKLCEDRKKEVQQKPCKHCGQMFTPDINHRDYCCKECLEEAKQLRKQNKPHKKTKSICKGYETLTAKKIQTLHDSGMSYADYQISKTMAMIPPIRTVL